jgi:hypothetical protein
MRPNQTKNGSQEPVLVQFGFGFFRFLELDFKALVEMEESGEEMEKEPEGLNKKVSYY